MRRSKSIVGTADSQMLFHARYGEYGDSVPEYGEESTGAAGPSSPVPRGPGSTSRGSEEVTIAGCLVARSATWLPSALSVDSADSMGCFNRTAVDYEFRKLKTWS